MSKKFSMLLAVIMIATLVLSACAPAATPAVEPTAPAAAPVEPTTASTGGEADCASADVFCVGLVTDVGKIDDKSFNQSAWEGVQQAQKELGATVQYIETTDPKDYAKNIGTFADAKYDVIVTVGFALGEATIEGAKQYPDIKFVGVDQFQGETVANVAGLIFPEDQAGFLVGALAGWMTKSNKIGAVLGTDAVPPVWRFGEGYKAGVKYANDKAEVTVVYHNDVGMDKTFTDPEWGKTTALSMIDKGVDVLFGAGGKTGNGALLGAAEKNVYAIGVDTDQYLTVPEAQKVLLSSALKDLTPGVYGLIKLAKDGKFPGGNYVGQAGYAPYHDLDSQVPAEVKTKMEELKAKIQSGEIKTEVPPTKPAQ